MLDHLSSRVDRCIRIEDGRFGVDRAAYTDNEIFRREMENIFSKCWLYVGHETELKKPDAFVTRNVGGRPVIFLRDVDGKIRCFFNVCPHRGAMICRERQGTTKNFSCIYHGWVFNNTGQVRSVVEQDTYAATHGNGGKNNLVPVPRFECYRGFWFLNYDSQSISLADYLGPACGYIDVIVDQAEQGMTVVGETQEYSARANWKLLAENSTDILHVEALHPTYLSLISTNSGGTMTRGKMEGASIDLGRGHAVVERDATYGRPIAKWISIWGEEAKREIDLIYARLVRDFGPEKANRMANKARNMLIFPNLVINDIMSLTVRVFQPVSPDYMEVNVWALAPIEELGKPALERRLTNFLEFLGPGGFATPDDIEALESCQRAAACAPMASWNDLSKGFKNDEDRVGDTKDELPQRAFWRGWRDQMLVGGI